MNNIYPPPKKETANLIKIGLLSVLIFTALLPLTACFNETPPEGNLTFIFSGNSARALAEFEDFSKTLMVITLTPENGSDSFTVEGYADNPITATVALGSYTVDVKAFLSSSNRGNEQLCAESEKTYEIEVKAGHSNTFPITMVWTLYGRSERNPFIVKNIESWSEAIAEMKNGTSNTPNYYYIKIEGDVEIEGSNNPTFGYEDQEGDVLPLENIEVTLIGNGTLKLDGEGSLINITGDQSSNDGVTQKLVINGPTLEGCEENYCALIKVEQGATLELIDGVICNNNNLEGLGGGVYVNGEFIMSGGTIIYNSCYHESNFVGYGGGVYVDSNGTFEMHSGTINGNSAEQGGGVCVYGTFTMSGGTISNGSAGKVNGGGVYVGENGTFTMYGGTISNNSAGNGGGVYVNTQGTFTKTGGIIYGNDAGDNSNNATSELIPDGRDTGVPAGAAVYYYVIINDYDSTAFYYNNTLNEGNNVDIDTIKEDESWYRKHF